MLGRENGVEFYRTSAVEYLFGGACQLRLSADARIESERALGNAERRLHPHTWRGRQAWYWHLVAPKLRLRGHEAIPVALPAADDTAGLSEYVDAVVRAIGNREPRRVVLVAQSLAGFTAPLVCERVPVALLVLVNAMIPKPGETPGEWWRSTRHREAKREQNRRDRREADAPFDPLVEFFHDVPQPVIDDAWAQGEPRQSDTVFASPCAFESWPAVPTRVLVARDDRFFPAEFQRRVARERLDISADQMPGGHLVALSQPDELTARLVAYAAEAWAA